MMIGYARISIADNSMDLETQFNELKSVNCKKIFQDQVLSAEARPELQSALETIRAGDTLVVTRLDRLARSASDCMLIIGKLEKKQAGLLILNLGMNTQTVMGKMFVMMLLEFAQFERELFLERQREGIAKAKAEGKYKGRKPIELDRQQEVLRLVAKGISKASVAKQLGIGEATVYRILKNRD